MYTHKCICDMCVYICGYIIYCVYVCVRAHTYDLYSIYNPIYSQFMNISYCTFRCNKQQE